VFSRAAALLLTAAAATAFAEESARPAAGVALNLPASATAAQRAEAVEAVRRTGATFFELPLSWSAAEPAPHRYALDELARTARLLRQSGATLQLDLLLVTEAARDVPSDLADAAFDDPRLSLRFGRLLDALGPALLDFQALSLGEAADAYFAERPGELAAYRRLFDGAVQYLRKKAPHLLVGVTTLAPTESPAPQVAAELHRRSPLLLYIYCPFERDKPFQHRPPAALEKDWTDLLSAAAGRPIGFPVVSYSSASENGSSPERQADFVRRLRRFLARADGRRLLFARWVDLRDAPPGKDGAPPVAVVLREKNREAFFAHRGLQAYSGEAKPAWRAWAKGP
jgi:hypothetical protein